MENKAMDEVVNCLLKKFGKETIIKNLINTVNDEKDLYNLISIITKKIGYEDLLSSIIKNINNSNNKGKILNDLFINISDKEDDDNNENKKYFYKFNNKKNTVIHKVNKIKNNKKNDSSDNSYEINSSINSINELDLKSFESDNKKIKKHKNKIKNNKDNNKVIRKVYYIPDSNGIEYRYSLIKSKGNEFIFKCSDQSCKAILKLTKDYKNFYFCKPHIKSFKNHSYIIKKRKNNVNCYESEYIYLKYDKKNFIKLDEKEEKINIKKDIKDKIKININLNKKKKFVDDDILLNNSSNNSNNNSRNNSNNNNSNNSNNSSNNSNNSNNNNNNKNKNEELKNDIIQKLNLLNN